jgi:hypothetical protein
MLQKPRGSLTLVWLAISSILSASAASVCTSTPAAAQSSVIYVNQAWSQDDREWYWHFSQGSAALAYDIFLNLEVAGGQDLFRSDTNIVRYGLIPDPPNRNNPDGLPIGISKATVTTPIKGWQAGDYVGLTCATMPLGATEVQGQVHPY